MLHLASVGTARARHVAQWGSAAAQLNEVGQQVEEAKGNAALEGMSRDELYQRAQDADIPGRSSMTKDELIAALAAKS